MAWQTRAAYYKSNLKTPMKMSGNSFERAVMFERFEAAVKHLMSTEEGSYLVDPDYGTPFQKSRTQLMNETTLSFMKERVKRKFSKYIPDIVLSDLEVDLSEYEDETIKITAVWILRSSDTARDALAFSGVPAPQRTTVLV
jgi:phage baseplate assembly protein W